MHTIIQDLRFAARSFRRSPGFSAIAIIAEKNGTPLAANFELAANAKGDVATRIKMGKTSDVIAVVKAGGKMYSARKNVKVTIGGCGG